MALLLLLLLTSLLSQIGHCAYVNVGIVNGSEVKAHSRPYIVSVQQNKTHICGGFLVTENLVMTAAHCWNPGTKLTVVLGAHDLKKDRSTFTRTEVKLYHIHPMYDSKTLFSDIMLLQLNKTIKKTKHISWISIPKKQDQNVKAKQVCSIAGWGRQSNNSRTSDRLMEVDVNIMDTKFCKLSWKDQFSISSMVCTNGHGGFLEGDSGGPLVCKNTAVGIISFYNPKKDKKTQLPYVYTKISKYLSWIKCISGQIK
ncbi:granzyme-like protein 1 [Tachysurus vachellii]|uniref:granzyme-like protein 1 n=1 Tax=Tachysurus vachellii TaxID=175792 RepID=UPI00296A9E2B|nr:granzyme-like protein 1 [Tachysurus vachellii]